MRLHQLFETPDFATMLRGACKTPITEAPLDSYELHGDFEQPGSLDAKDRKLTSSPKHVERMTKLLKTARENIAVHIVNISAEKLRAMGHTTADSRDVEGGKLSRFYNLGAVEGGPVGEFSSRDLKTRFGINIPAKPDCINIVILGNAQGDHALTAWMIIHRLTHMIEDATTKDGPIDPELASAWQELAHIIKAGITVHELNNPNRRFFASDIQKMATMKSASSPTGTELANEFLTQYLVKGDIILKPLDGVPEAYRKQYETKLVNICFDIEQMLVGKIFVSF